MFEFLSFSLGHFKNEIVLTGVCGCEGVLELRQSGLWCPRVQRGGAVVAEHAPSAPAG